MATTVEYLKRAKELADRYNLVMRVFGDGNNFYFYNANQHHTVFDFTNKHLISFRAASHAWNNDTPIEMNVCDFDQIQQVKLFLTPEAVDGAAEIYPLDGLNLKEIKDLGSYYGSSNPGTQMPIIGKNPTPYPYPKKE